MNNLIPFPSFNVCHIFRLNCLLSLCFIMNTCFPWIYPHVSRLAQSSIRLEIIKWLVPGMLVPLFGKCNNWNIIPRWPIHPHCIFFNILWYVSFLLIFCNISTLYTEISAPGEFLHCISFTKLTFVYFSVIPWGELRLDKLILIL